MALTDVQWDAIKQNLLNPLGHRVWLSVPGHRLTLEPCFVPREQRLVTAVYVDGQCRGEWMGEDSPIGQRFYQLRTTRAIPKAEAEASYKRLRKFYRHADARRLSGLDAVVTFRDPWWTSVNRLIAHLKKNEPAICMAERTTE